jgi:hypothetical protein
MKDDEIPWTKAQMMDAVLMYQTALGEIQAAVDSLVVLGKERALSREVLEVMDEISVTIVAATLDVAKKLDT